MKTILETMNKIKSELETLHKDGTNPYFNSKYTTLNSVYEAIGTKIEENGLSLLQKTRYEVVGEKLLPILDTVITHLESGEIIDSPMPLIGVGNMQNLGSAITYARRYSLIALFGMKQEDDDGNSSKIGATVAPEKDPFADTKDPFDTDNFVITKKGGE